MLAPAPQVFVQAPEVLTSSLLPPTQMSTAITIAHEHIHEWFTETAARNPSAVAIECGERQVSYGELLERSNTLANYLIAQGAGRDSIVALLMADTSERIVGILGSLKAGAAFMPLDVRQPVARLRKLLELAPPQFLLTETKVLAGLGQLLPAENGSLKVMCVDGPTSVQYLHHRDTEHTEVAQRSSDPDQLSYIYFTSGSSGTPKAIAGRLKGLAHFINWEIEELGVGAGVRVSQLLSPSFDGSLRDIFLPLCVGGVVCVPAQREQVLEGRGLVQWLEEARIEVLHCVPSVFRALVNEELRAAELPALRYVVMAGESLLGRDVAKWKQVYGERVGLLNLYGTSETTMAKFSYRVGVGDEEREVMPIGKPIEGAQALILNSNGEPCKRGMVGEIYIRTPYRSLGYYGQPELTAAVFVPNPFSTDASDLVHKTGDMGRVLEDGNFEYLGRRDEQVKVRGARVELKEVENAVRGQAGVLDVAVIEREDGSGYTYLCAYLVLADGVQTVAVAEGLEQELPDYMLPSAYVEMAELPRTISGKVDRRALPEVGAGGGAEYVAARTPVEELLVGSWEQLLGRERVGIEDNFFRMGGHSLLATQVMSRVRESFGVEVGLRVLFEYPTVRGLGAVIEEKLRGAEGQTAPAIVKVARAGELQLSYAQQRLWFLDQLEPGSNAYNMGAAVRLQGIVDLTALEQSFREVIRRHEALRTTFAVVAGRPVQVIDAAPEFTLAVVDLSTVAEAEAEAQRAAAEESQRPFDLTTGPLLRASVLRLSEQEHVLLCTMHHIISDGWSMGVLIKELTTLYEAYATGQQSPLPDLEIQYADYAHWQREWLRGEVLEKQLSYWKQQLAVAPAVLELPTDYPRPAVQTFRGAHQSLTFSETVSAQLKELSQRECVTLFMTLLAAFQTLLSRYSGQQEIVVGTPIANRNRAEIEDLIGFFVNTLVLRTDLTGDPSFADVLQQVREVALGAYAHQDVPFELLVEELQPDRDMSRTPLFQVLMVLHNAPVAAVEIKTELRLGSVGVENHTAKFDLTLSLSETGDGRLHSLWEYNTDLFGLATIQRMMKHFEVLLGRVAGSAEKRLSELGLLTDEEREQIVVIWNDTAVNYPSEKCIHELFEEQVQRTPDAVAVLGEHEQLSYRELNDRANRLAHYLQSLGVRPESLVGICVERSVEMVVGLLGILKAGGAYVPLDPAYPQERLSYMIEDAHVSVLLTQQHLLDTLPAHATPTFCLDSDSPQLAHCSVLNPSRIVDTDNLAYLIYTSGSTGRPKAAGVSHAGFTNLLSWYLTEFGISGSDRLLLMSSFSFDLTQKNIFGPLLVGARLYLSETRFFDAQAITELLGREQITLLNCTPSAFYPLVETSEEQGWAQLTELREVFLGGEVINLERLRRWLDQSEAEVVNTYGPTECTDVVAYHRVSKKEVQAAGVVPIGRGVWNTTLYLLDAEMGVVPIGVKGELYVGGRGVGRGYVGDAALTGKRFIPDPFSTEGGARLYRTGDVGRYGEDGDIEYLGRMDHQVKVRGFRIEVGEVETTLLGHALVREAAVVARGDGAGEQRLVAYIVPDVVAEAEGPAAPTSSELREYLGERLPDYMVPSAFVMLDQLPLTPSGKVDRRALPAPNASHLAFAENHVAARTPTEEILADIWARVLQVEEVGVHDDFFALGGYSLLAIQVIFQVRDSFQVEIPLRRMFERPTIAGLAEIVEETLKAGHGLQLLPIERVSREQELPLSFAQERQWLLDQLMPNSGAYNIPAAVRLRGAFDVTALERTLTEIVRRHEGLRTTFVGVAGRPLQKISSPQPVTLPVHDLSDLSEAERESEAQRLTQVESQRPFDLARGPLLRVSLLRLAAEDHVVLYTMHHIVSDAWSMDVLVREVRALYEAFSNGAPSPLPELPLQYVDFAHWQRQWLQGEVLEEQINYWREQLADAPPVMDLPTDRPRPAVQSLRGAKHQVALSRELTGSLKELSRREGVTLFMTLLAGFQVLLSRYTGQSHVVVGSATANRTRPEIEGLVGYFINHLTLHTDLSGNPDFPELLRRVRTMCLAAYAHQDVPFEKLLEELRLERDARYSPLFQVMFVLQPRQETSSETAGLESLSTSAIGVERIGANVDLNLSLVETGQGVQGIMEYRTDLFDSDTIDYLVHSYIELLEKAAAEPGVALAQFELPGELQAKVKAARAREQKQVIAIAATFTAEPLEDSLKFWMEELDLPSDIEFAPYSQVFQQLLDPGSLFGKNERGVNLVLLRFEDWLRYERNEIATQTEDPEPILKIEGHVRDLLDAFRAAATQQRTGTPYIVCMCPAAPLQVDDSDRGALFQRMEELMSAELETLNGVYFVSLSELTAAYPVENYYDLTTDEVGHVPFTPLFYTALGTTIARKLQSLRSAPYKVIVLDCDQTLWKGVCAEDGPLGIEIDAPRKDFQEFLVAQHDAGMLLCLCSKNQEEDVIEVFEKRPDMPLSRAHLASHRINWRPKSENIIGLAQELGLGLDSFIFIDNDPLECAEMQGRCPEVLTLELPQEEAEITRFLRHVWAFDHSSVTAEDKQRTTLYQQNMERERFRRESFNLEEFLTELELKVEITEAGPHHWARVAQLTQRTNQFNVSTVRRTEAEIEQFCHHGPGCCLVVNVEDRFGSYGLVGVVIFTEEGDEAIQVETLLLSCRVLGRGVEHRVLIELGQAARERGRKRIDVYYRESKKNEPALNALEAVAGPYKEPHGDGYLFRIPLEVALNPASFNSEMASTRVDGGPKSAAAGAVVEGRAKSAVIRRIATTFYSSEQVLKAIELRKQTDRSEAAGVYVAPRTPIEEMLAEIWATVLSVTQVGVNDNFFTLGGHSLLGTVMISRVRDALRVELPLLSLFESPTVAGLSEIVERSLIEQADVDEMAELLKELEDLSEDEISALLTSEGGRLE
jgi:amino acid adenylation domain-containing protein/FkbH-like protein